MKKEKKRFRVSKYICLAFAIALNSFIIFYSFLDDQSTVKMNGAFTNIFTSLVNTFTKKDIKVVPVTNIGTSFSSKEKYQYNYVNGYKLEEIPLGSAKQIECAIQPSDAANKAISYTAQPSDVVSLSVSGSTVSVIGMKTGECVITAKSSDGGYESSVNLKVIEPIAPASYKISLSNTDIPMGSIQTIDFDIDGGSSSNIEQINFRYYDIRKLSYSSENESVATVDNDGVIHPISIGASKITVSNGTISKSLDINVVDGVAPTPYTNLSIEGSDVCYANDMLLDETSNKHHYQLVPKDGNKNLNPEDFTWSSSNDLLVRVDKHGVVRGFRKSIVEDETAIITAKSKITGQTASFEITVKNQLPSSMNYGLTMDKKTHWDLKDYSLTVGADIKLTASYDVSNPSTDTVFESSNPEVVSIIDNGNTATLQVLKEGTAQITIRCTLNPELKATFKCTVIKAGAIEAKDMTDLGAFLRKSIGHASVFMLAQLFTFLTLFMFFYDKKWWFYSSISLGEGLLLACLSELIQFFVPTRDGALLDIAIDFGGVVVGALLAFLIVLIIKRVNKRKEETNNELE